MDELIAYIIIFLVLHLPLIYASVSIYYITKVKQDPNYDTHKLYPATVTGLTIGTIIGIVLQIVLWYLYWHLYKK